MIVLREREKGRAVGGRERGSRRAVRGRESARVREEGPGKRERERERERDGPNRRWRRLDRTSCETALLPPSLGAPSEPGAGSGTERPKANRAVTRTKLADTSGTAFNSGQRSVHQQAGGTPAMRCIHAAYTRPTARGQLRRETRTHACMRARREATCGVAAFRGILDLEGFARVALRLGADVQKQALRARVVRACLVRRLHSSLEARDFAQDGVGHAALCAPHGHL